jgi:simple sugar transport system substrate-binding protein
MEADMTHARAPIRQLAAAMVTIVVTIGALTGCSSAKKAAADKGTGGQDKKIRIAVVTHAQAGVEFWTVVKNGVDAAAKAENVTVNYQSPPTFDMVAMSRLIDAAVATHPDGLVVSIPDPKALGPAIKRAVSAGIPVVSINSGGDVFKSFGALVHVGQEEYQAGYGGGLKMAQAGVHKALCLNGEVGNAALDQRCKGFADALAKSGGTSDVLAVKLTDPTSTQQTTQAALSSKHPDGLFAVSASSVIPALAAVKADNDNGKVKLATFDLGADVLTDIKNGDILFAIDQQQYLQGYLPIVFLANYIRLGIMPAQGQVVPTGPNFVTQDNAAQAIQLSKEGLR